MLRRLLALFLLLLTVHLCCGVGPAMAQTAVIAGIEEVMIAPTLSEPASAPAEEIHTVFKSGAKFDPATHQWVDRYNGKTMYLGLPGVIGRYGVGNVIASNDLVADGSGPSTTTTTGSTFPYQKLLWFSLIGIGIGTAIAVPVGVGILRQRHWRHHLNNTWQQNRVAAYYYFHNQTLPPPHFNTTVIIHHESGPPPPPPQGGGK